MRQSLIKAPLIRAALLSALIIPAGACMAEQDKASAEPAAAASADSNGAFAAALAADSRTPANAARDKYRHPAETLAFFGVDPGDTVVELWPGGGWYTEVLAPYLAASGKLYVVPPAGRAAESIQKKVAGSPVYAKVTVAPVAAGQTPSAVPAGSADVVLTFRNIHNGLMADQPYADAVFAEAFRMLKPGGTLGIVEHRLPDEADAARERESGYVKTSTVKALAQKAGFRFVEASEVNANPKDTKDYAKGVWTLPPTFTLGDVDKDKYLAIGESDRMTLKFVKPE